MDARAKEKLPPSSWTANPGYVIAFDPLPVPVRVALGGETVAESDDARVMYELGHAPVYYLPLGDVDERPLVPSERHTHCPYKGDARYWSVRAAGGEVVEDAIWAYRDPYDEMAHLAGWAGFYWDRFEWYEAGERVASPREIAGRCNERTHFAALYPELAREWHPERNPRLKPYEFPADSGTVVWWRDVEGREWAESVRARALRSGRR